MEIHLQRNISKNCKKEVRKKNRLKCHWIWIRNGKTQQNVCTMIAYKTKGKHIRNAKQNYYANYYFLNKT